MTKKKNIRTYSELRKLKTFEERYEYLKLNGVVGHETFGINRYLNQAFYTSDIWKKARNTVIQRDEGCDLGIEGHEIFDKIYVHHMNPITEEDLLEANPDIIDPEYLICTTKQTHDYIHYGRDGELINPLIERKPNDTTLW